MMFIEQDNESIRTMLRLYPEFENLRDRVYFINASYNNLVQYDIVELRNFIKSKISEGKFIVFDNAAETILTYVYKIIHDIIDEIDVSDSYFFSLCGALDGEAGYELARKKYNFKKRLQVICYHHHEKQMRENHVPEKFDKIYKIEKKSKKFLCFNKIERYHRFYLYAHAIKHGWFSDSFFSFEGSKTDFLEIYTSNSNYCNEDIYYPHMNEWVQNILIDTKDKFPIRLNITENRKNPIHLDDSDSFYYENSYISIVTETLFYKILEDKAADLSRAFQEPAYKFLTEKTFKPIVIKHPFIIVGTPGVLDILKDSGYKTFHPFIDETYDTIEDDYERMNALTKEIIRLSKLSDNEWISLQENIKYIVEHNHKHFFFGRNNYVHTPWNNSWFNIQDIK